MDLENKKNFPKSFTYFEVAFITVALVIGLIIHELNISSITKMLFVLLIALIIIFLGKVKFGENWRFTKVGTINIYVFWGYILIVYFVLSNVIHF